MFRYLFILILVWVTPLYATEINGLPYELDSLSRSIGLEFVYGEKMFPIVNPYGGYGSSAVFDFTDTSIGKSVLFLCRRKSELYQELEVESSRDLVFNYDYFLVFALKKNDGNYEIKDIISEGVGLKGMTLYHGISSFQLSEFNYLKDPLKKGPDGLVADFTNGCVPILISSESSTTVYYYYEGYWLEYVERVY